MLLTISLLYLPLPQNSHAGSENSIIFEHPINTDSYNMSITQDREGFLWIGTSEGVARYDGYNLKRYKTGPGSISDNMAPSVFVDREGLIWIATMGGGLNCYDKKTGIFKHFRHDPNNRDSICSDHFNWAPKTIAQDRLGRIWVGTQNGLDSLDKNTGKFTHYSHNPLKPTSMRDNSILTVFADSRNRIWAGTKKGGLSRYNQETGVFKHFRHLPQTPLSPGSLGRGAVHAVMEDSRGEIWVGTSGGGLDRISSKDDTITHYRHDTEKNMGEKNCPVYSLAEDHRGHIWISHSFTIATDIERLNPHTGEFTYFRHNPDSQNSISGNNVMSFFKDRVGTLWIVGNTGFIDKYDPLGQNFQLYGYNPQQKNSLGSKTQIMIYEDKKEIIWIASGSNGLIRYNRDTNDFTVYPVTGDSPLTVYSVQEDSSGRFWVGTGNGKLNIFSRKSGRIEKTFENPHGPLAPWSLTQDRIHENLLWFGTQEDGLFCFNKDTEAFQQFKHIPGNPESLSNNAVFSIFQDPSGTIWVPTRKGLNRLDRDTGTFKRFFHDPEDPASLGGNAAIQCLTDSRGNLWVSTEDGGLSLYHEKQEEFTTFSHKQGFTTNSLRTMLEDGKGNLWISSDNGIFQFDTRQKKVVHHFTNSDGLQGNKFNPFASTALKTKNGEMWFSSLSGVCRFYPEKIRLNPYMPEMAITSFRHGRYEKEFNSAVEKASEINLSWKENSFDFEFTALNFTHPENNRYAYILENFEKEANQAGKRRYGKYTNLPGGSYVLKVFGSNNNGIWNENGVALKINVESPPWKRWWAFAGYLLVMASVFFCFSNRRSRIYKLELDYHRKELQRERDATQKLRNLDKIRAELMERQSIAEMKLRESRNILETTVAERTRELKHANQNLKLEIIERIRTEEDLISQKNFTENLIDTAQVIIISITPQKNVMIFNKHAETLTGLKREEAVGRGFLNLLIPKEQRKSVSARLGAVLTDHNSHIDGESHIVTSSGEIKHIRWNGNAIKNKDGKIKGILGIGMDITEYKNSQELLIQTEKMVSVGGLAAGIAHELNNPLAGVLQNMQVVGNRLKSDLPANTRTAMECGTTISVINEYMNRRDIFKMIDMVTREGARAAEIVKNILSFSRSSGTEKKLSSIPELLDDAIKIAESDYDLTTRYDFKQINIKRNYALEVPLVMCEATSIKQVFFNILKNGAQAMTGSRGDEKSSFTLNITSSTSIVKIDILDNGTGMDQNIRKRIFEPFFTTKSVGSGTGLGLYVSFFIVTENHGGTLSVKSKTGMGSRFTITLPLGKNHPPLN